jgi:glycosyltransferase involved in cell wall biosynthesis
MKNLHFFTTNFPCGTGENFVSDELFSLAKIYDRVYIYPLKAKSSDIVTKKTPHNAQVIFFNEKVINRKEIILSLKANKFLYFIILMCEFISEPKKVFNKLMFSKKIITYLNYSMVCFSRLKEFSNNRDDFYSFWMNENALALSILKKEKRIKNFSFRVHGFDIFNHVQKGGFIPFRIYNFKQTKYVHNISALNVKYLELNYPKYKGKYQLSYLGSKDYGLGKIDKVSKEFVLFSCSNIIPLKRVDSIVQTLSKIKNYKIEWYHAGDGIDREKVEALVENLPINCKVKLLGNLKHEDVFKFYLNTKVDLFIHLSESEGLPVSMMEAISFGVPILATDVGGVSEIVTKETGFLIPKNFKIEVVVNLLCMIIRGEGEFKIQRTKVREFWEQRFNHKKNIGQLTKFF